MFGDKSILCNCEVRVDDIGRFSLPAILGGKSKDIVVLKPSEVIEGAYELYSEKYVSKIMDELFQKSISAKTKEEAITYKERLIAYSKSMERTVALQSGGRVAFLKELSGFDKVVLTGCSKFLLIEPIKTKSDENTESTIKK